MFALITADECRNGDYQIYNRERLFNPFCMKFASGNNWGADKTLSDAEFSAMDLSINMEKYEKNGCINT